MDPAPRKPHADTGSSHLTIPSPTVDSRMFADIVERDPEPTMILVPPDFACAYLNEGARMLLGREDAIGKPFAEVAPQLAGELGPAFGRVMSVKRPYVVSDVRTDVPRFGKTARSAYFTFALSPLDTSGGNTALLLQASETTAAVMALMASEEAAERALREAGELDAVFRNLTDAVLVFDSSGKIVHANPAAVSTLAFDPVGMSRRDVVRALDYRDAAGRRVTGDRTPAARALRGERVVDEPLTLRRNDGARQSVLVSASAFSAQGSTLGVAVTLHDVTEREQLLAESRESHALSDALNRINAAIDSSLDFDSIMEAVVRESSLVLGADRAAVAVPETGGWVARYLFGGPPGVTSIPVPESDAPNIDELAASPEPIIITDAAPDPRVSPGDARHGSFGALVAIRLESRGELVGMLRFVWANRPIEFGPRRRDFLEKLAAVVSLGLENARLLAAERHVSDTLQSALLAIPKAVTGIDCGTLYRSASETARVGGDFYDLFELERHGAALVIGDVSGKGLPAAALTALVKNTIRAYAEEGHDPATTLSMTNTVVLASSETETFVTVFLGYLESGSGDLLYCGAGHPRPILKRHDGTVEVLETRSPVIGAFEGGAFADTWARLGRGDVLLLYTDGVTEAHCPDGLLGETRLVEFIEKLPPTRPGGLPEKVFDFVLDCAGGELSDDVAILAVGLTRYRAGASAYT